MVPFTYSHLHLCVRRAFSNRLVTVTEFSSALSRRTPKHKRGWSLKKLRIVHSACVSLDPLRGSCVGTHLYDVRARRRSLKSLMTPHFTLSSGGNQSCHHTAIIAASALIKSGDCLHSQIRLINRLFQRSRSYRPGAGRAFGTFFSQSGVRNVKTGITSRIWKKSPFEDSLCF